MKAIENHAIYHEDVTEWVRDRPLFFWSGEMKIFSRQTIFFCVVFCANNFFPAASSCKQFFCVFVIIIIIIFIIIITFIYIRLKFIR